MQVFSWLVEPDKLLQTGQKSLKLMQLHFLFNYICWRVFHMLYRDILCPACRCLGTCCPHYNPNPNPNTQKQSVIFEPTAHSLTTVVRGGLTLNVGHLQYQSYSLVPIEANMKPLSLHCWLPPYCHNTTLEPSRILPLIMYTSWFHRWPVENLISRQHETL